MLRNPPPPLLNVFYAGEKEGSLEGKNVRGHHRWEPKVSGMGSRVLKEL